MKKSLLTLLITTALMSQTASSLVLRVHTYLECEAVDGKQIKLNHTEGQFTLAHGDMANPDNRISVRHHEATYHSYTENNMTFYSISATEGNKSYTIFQSQDKNPTLAGITTKVGNITQKTLCKPKQREFPFAKFTLNEIFQNLKYYQNGEYYKNRGKPST